MSEQVKCDRCGLTTGPYDREGWTRCESAGETLGPHAIPGTIDLCSLDCASSYFRNRLIDSRAKATPRKPDEDEEPF